MVYVYEVGKDWGAVVIGVVVTENPRSLKWCNGTAGVGVTTTLEAIARPLAV